MSEAQIRFVAGPQVEDRLSFLSFPAPTILTVPTTADPHALDQVLRSTLLEYNDDDIVKLKLAKVNFDFVVSHAFLRSSLGDALAKDSSASEKVIDVVFVDSTKAPIPIDSPMHDDWVSGVDVSGTMVVASCYDNSVIVYSMENENNEQEGEKKRRAVKRLVLPTHTSPVTDVAFIPNSNENSQENVSDKVLKFVSASHDATAVLHEYDVDANKVVRTNVCRGHERSVDCVSTNTNYLATGSFDSTLKVWSTKLVDKEDPLETKAGEAKKSRTVSHSSVTRTPLLTLAGHKEGITGVSWNGLSDLCSCSMDHTIKTWDCEMQGMKSEIVANKALFSIHTSLDNSKLLASGADPAIRLYDLRASSSNSVVQALFHSHSGWVMSVYWSPHREHLFVSAGNDQLVKMWDVRSNRAPIFDLKGHEDRVLDAKWASIDKDERVVIPETDGTIYPTIGSHLDGSTIKE